MYYFPLFIICCCYNCSDGIGKIEFVFKVLHNLFVCFLFLFFFCLRLKVDNHNTKAIVEIVKRYHQRYMR